VSVTLRALGFVALFQAAGTAFFLTLFGGQLTESGSGIRRLGLFAASGGILLVVAHLSLDAARMAGEYTGLWDGDLQRRAWMSTNGAAQLLQAFGLLWVAVGLRRGGKLALATAGGVLALIALLLTGHTSVNALRWLLAPLLAVHLLIVAFWFGALAPLYSVTQRESINVAAKVVARFSAIAGWLVPCIALAGLGMALVLVPDLSVLRRPYGLLLLGKLGGFGLLMILAAFNKWRLTPALSAGATSSLPALRRSIVAEFLLIVLVLGLTATLTTFYSPEN
jgi:putative copper export protein